MHYDGQEYLSFKHENVIFKALLVRCEKGTWSWALEAKPEIFTEDGTPAKSCIVSGWSSPAPRPEDKKKNTPKTQNITRLAPAACKVSIPASSHPHFPDGQQTTDRIKAKFWGSMRMCGHDALVEGCESRAAFKCIQPPHPHCTSGPQGLQNLNMVRFGHQALSPNLVPHLPCTPALCWATWEQPPSPRMPPTPGLPLGSSKHHPALAWCKGPWSTAATWGLRSCLGMWTRVAPQNSPSPHCICRCYYQFQNLPGKRIQPSSLSQFVSGALICFIVTG